jgi:hypothetical protein
MSNSENALRKRIRICIWIIIVGLAISGITAFPIETELSILVKDDTLPVFMQEWIFKVYNALKESNINYPFLSYGTDWLAFAHVMLAVLFYGTLKDPIRNIWIIKFGMICCILIVPLALIAGSIRQIPLFWRLIDCSFGVIGIIPLILCYRNIKKLENNQSKTYSWGL